MNDTLKVGDLIELLERIPNKDAPLVLQTQDGALHYLKFEGLVSDFDESYGDWSEYVRLDQSDEQYVVF